MNEKQIKEMDDFKKVFRPRTSYKVIMFVTPEGKFCGAVFRKQEIVTKKEGVIETDVSIYTNTAATIESFRNMFHLYLEKI